jgi:hypothetical protein
MIVIPGLPPIPCGIFCPPAPPAVAPGPRATPPPGPAIPGRPGTDTDTAPVTRPGARTNSAATPGHPRLRPHPKANPEQAGALPGNPTLTW